MGEEAERVKEETVEGSEDETAMTHVQEKAQEQAGKDTAESAEAGQAKTPQKEGSGKILYGIGVVCAVLLAVIAGIILIRRCKRDS